MQYIPFILILKCRALYFGIKLSYFKKNLCERVHASLTCCMSYCAVDISSLWTLKLYTVSISLTSGYKWSDRVVAVQCSGIHRYRGQRSGFKQKQKVANTTCLTGCWQYILCMVRHLERACMYNYTDSASRLHMASQQKLLDFAFVF